MDCEALGHLFVNTVPKTCIDCGIALSKYDLIKAREGRVFIVGQLNSKEKKRFDKANSRGNFKLMSKIMTGAFRRYGIDITKEQSRLTIDGPL